MKTKIKKTLSAVLAFSFIGGSMLFAACGKKEQSSTSTLPSEITDDMPWYNGTCTEVDTGLDEFEFEYLSTYAVGAIGERVVFATDGQLLSSPWTYAPDVGKWYLHVYDADGGFLYNADLVQMINDYAPDTEHVYISDISQISDQVRLAVIRTFSGVSHEYYFYFDPVSGTIVSDEEIVRNVDEYTNYKTETRHLNTDGWDVSIFSVNLPDGSMPDCHMSFTAPDGTESYFILSEAVPYVTILGIFNYIYLGDGRFVFTTMNYSYDERYIYIDAVNNEASMLDESSEFAWISDISDLGDYEYFDGVGNVSVSVDGLKIIDIEQEQVSDYLSFDYCDINRFDAQFLDLLEATEDKIILAGTVYREQLNLSFGGEPENIAPVIVVLDRADTNPHVSKTVISAAFLRSFSYPMAEAVRRFNATSPDSIIMMDPRYRYDVVAEDVLFEDDMDFDTYELSVESAMMSKLSIDLLAGEGPDLIIGAMDYAQLNSPDMLLDLKDDVSVADVYGNIMEMSMTNGGLYQVPLTFALEGIVCDRGDVDDQPGFDFESYREYISGPCNGQDPNRMTKLTFMCTCLAEMSEVFAQNGGYDYNNDEFAEVAAFVNGLILPDELDEETIQMYWTSAEDDPYASDFVSVGSGKELLAVTNGKIDEQVIMGFPSSEPRGLMVDVGQSIAVSAGASDPDACRRFVRMLVDDEFQTLFAHYSGIPVNRAAQETECVRFAEEHNAQYQALSEYYTMQDLIDFDYPQAEADPDELASQMNDYVTNASGLHHTDAAVEIIVREEIQGYFAGQMTIDQVMSVIQSRVDNFVNERG